MERVNKELAIALKGKGYDVPANENYFEGSDQSRYAQDGEYRNHNKIDITISAPYLDEVIDWLSDKGIEVCPVKSYSAGWLLEIYEKQGDNYPRVEGYPRHEPTRSAAKIAGINKSLELLKSK